jgi:hypothetical protein
MPDEKPAASSAAVLEPIEVEDLTPPQRDEWLKTGDRPAKEQKEPAAKKEESAPSEPAADKDGKKAESGTAKNKTEERFQEILKDRAELRRELDELKKKLEAPRDEKKEAASSAAAPAEKPTAPEKPKRAAFASDEEYEKAYEETYLPKKKAFDDATAAFEKQQAEINERQKGLLGSWKGIADKGKEIYGEGDWRKVTESYKDFQIFAGDPFEVQLRSAEPEVAARFMQYMSLKPKDVERIMKLPIREQFKELDALETALREELGGKKAAEKKEETPPKKEKELTKAGKPPQEIGGTAATSEDEAEAALKRGDGEAYRNIMNKREIDKRKARQRR